MDIITLPTVKKFFTSDLHINHKNILKYTDRGKYFKDIEEHNQHIINRINSLVKKGDQLFILGDVCWGNCIWFKSQIKCKNIFVCFGNHDSKAKVRSAFGEQCYYIHITKIKDIKTVLCHYPMLSWPSSNWGSFMLSGHQHGIGEDFLNKFLPERRGMDVGIDVSKILLGDYEPFSEDFIYDRLIKRSKSNL